MDSAICSNNEASIRLFAGGFLNVLPIEKGRDYSAETYVDGVYVPAQEAVGDTATWYTSIRSNEQIVLPDGVQYADVDIVKKLCGVWA